MNNQMVIFEGIDIAVLTADSKIWFRATEVSKLLAFSNGYEAVQTHCKETQYREWKVGKGRPALYVTEAGLYRLILRSKAPVAVSFQDWVCDEILPSVREYGFYATPEMQAKIHSAFLLMREAYTDLIEAWLSDPVIIKFVEDHPLAKKVFEVNQNKCSAAFNELWDLAEMLNSPIDPTIADYVVNDATGKAEFIK